MRFELHEERAVEITKYTCGEDLSVAKEENYREKKSEKTRDSYPLMRGYCSEVSEKGSIFGRRISRRTCRLLKDWERERRKLQAPIVEQRDRAAEISVNFWQRSFKETLPGCPDRSGK